MCGSSGLYGFGSVAVSGYVMLINHVVDRRSRGVPFSLPDFGEVLAPI